MEIQQQESSKQSRKRKVRQKRSSTFIDMTPMVDLAFLLLTFFILTTSFQKMRTIDIQVPDNTPNKNPNTIGESQAFNLILFNDGSVKWYIGADDKVSSSVRATFSEANQNSI